MRHTELWARLDMALGQSYSRHWAKQHAITELGSRTVEEALDSGEDPKVVWAAVWRVLGLPASDR
ncbi:MAG: DUF3046 domain-containing protein [Nocardioides sp.]|nr:DUF3046 domain-containing protein [Nocardioides sp.]